MMAPAAKDLKNTTDGEAILCKRCNTTAATQKTRQDPVCDNCFVQYVTTKAVKRMESYKARGSNFKQVKKILLPFSFGPSSTALLYILDTQLQGQFKRMGRTSYELHIVHVNLNTQVPGNSKEILERMDKIKDLFPTHSYTVLGIEDSLNIPSIDWSSLGLPFLSPPPSTADPKNLKTRFETMLESLPSPTAREDITSTLLTRLLLYHARTSNYNSILFGDSTTRLAERTLTSTAAGRGFSLPWLVSDGPIPSPTPPSPQIYPTSTPQQSTPPTPINLQYPLRDILKKELITLIHLLPSISPLITYDPSLKHISASSKTTTINDLMVQYFESVEENYPSIVANVVRTSSKLVPEGVVHRMGRCGICGSPVAEGMDGMFGWGGDQNDDRTAGVVAAGRGNQGDGDGGGGGRGILCYGCSRSVHG